jgi:hypothetical protein
MSSPTITSIDPSTGTSLGGQNVTINGTDLTLVTDVTFGITPATNVAYTSDGTVTCTTPAGTDGSSVDVAVSNGWIASSSSSTAGKTWIRMAISSSGQYQIATDGTYLYTSINTGTDWANTSGNTDTSGNLLPTANWKSVAISSDGMYQAASLYPGGVYYSADYGSSWTKTNFDTSGYWRSVAIAPEATPSTAVHITACTDNVGSFGGWLYISSNAGTNVTKKTLDGISSSPWRGVTMSSDGKYQVACIKAGITWYSINYGSGFDKGNVISSVAEWGIPSISSDGTYVTNTSYGGDIYTSSNQGISWTPRTSFTGNWTSVSVSSEGQYQSASNGINLYISDDFGSTWTVNETATTANYQGTGISADGKIQTACVSGGNIYTYISSNSESYTYSSTTPYITSITPSSGTSFGGQSVKITGTGFTSASTVTFDTTDVTSTFSTLDGSITCTTPAGSGPVNVTVTDTAGVSNFVEYTYSDSDPYISGLSPSVVPIAGGDLVTISGIGFDSTSSVTVNGSDATDVTYNMDGSLTFTAGPGIYGTLADVIVTTGIITSNMVTYMYVDSPSITSVVPSSGTTAGGTPITITGTNFLNATVTIGGKNVTNLIVVSSTKITCTTPAGSSGPVTLVVDVGDTTTATATYTYNKEIISNICFPAGTPITTDQGNISIEKINPTIHTIHNNKIVAITKTITQDTYLVCFEKHSLGLNKPNKKTITSKRHKVYYNETMIEAHHFLSRFKNVKKVEYTGEILYNVLMEKHDKLKVNNLTFETLDPKNIIAQLYTSNFDEEYKNKIVVMLNHSIMQKDHRLYQNIINRVVNDKSLSMCFEEHEHNKIDNVVAKPVKQNNTFAPQSHQEQRQRQRQRRSAKIKMNLNLVDNVNSQSNVDEYIKMYKIKSIL